MAARAFPTCTESKFVMAGLDPAIHDDAQYAQQ